MQKNQDLLDLTMTTKIIKVCSKSNSQIKALLLLLYQDQDIKISSHNSIQHTIHVKEVFSRSNLDLPLHRMNRPTEIAEEVSSSVVKVTLLIDDLVAPLFGNKQKPKNGEVYVDFFKRGFDMEAIIHDKDGKEAKWLYNVKTLPSEIDMKKSSWKVDKGMVVIKLVKKEEMSWQPMLRNGLEQDSSSDDEGVD